MCRRLSDINEISRYLKSGLVPGAGLLEQCGLRPLVNYRRPAYHRAFFCLYQSRMSILTINLLVRLSHFIWLLLICLAHLLSLHIASTASVISYPNMWICLLRGKSGIDIYGTAFGLPELGKFRREKSSARA